MKISVVTICYNAADLIEDTIRSVISQSYQNMEYIVIDGASQDGTVDIIKKYHDRITYWKSEPDKGIYDAMNKGVAVSAGDYVIFMNAGDKFTDEYVMERVVPLLDGSTIVSGHWRRCYKDGTVKDDKPMSLQKISTEMPICHQATFVSLPYHKMHPFDMSYKYSADYDFFYKAWKNNVKFKMIDVVVADFVVDQGASNSHVTESVLEREMAWSGETGLALRRINLRCQIVRIKCVLFLKRILNNK